MAQELSGIRKKIDSIDDQVHDLLMERASLVSSVAATKRKHGLQIVQPAREARMIRRLLKRHQGPLPQATIVRIWRELVGSVSLLQTGLTVAVAATQGNSSHWDIAKDYFGSAVPMKKINGPSNTVSAVSENEASFAVMPWPELEASSPWWAHLFDRPNDPISIICALPYGIEKKDDSEESHKALVISKIDYMPSDDDVTFIGIKLSGDMSRAKVTQIFEKTGFEVLNIYTARNDQASLFLCIAEVKGYFSKDFAEQNDLKERFEGTCFSCESLGGYPLIPDLMRPQIIEA